MRRYWARLILFLILCGVVSAEVRRAPAEHMLPRVILAFYSGREEPEIVDTKLHRVAEMPLNYLGCSVTYLDVNQSLPRLDDLDDVRGILTWFQSDDMKDPKGFIQWVEEAVRRGKKLVMLGDSGVRRDYQNRATPQALVDRFLALLGVQDLGEWTRLTYDCRFVYKDPQMMEFERPLAGVLPPFDHLRTIDPRAQSFLVVRHGDNPDSDSHLTVINSHGGFIAPEYTVYTGEGAHRKQLHANLFEFFRLAFNTDDLPKPDVTTMAGRRIFYSHIDGDGWRNESEVPGYREKGELSAKVIFDKVLKLFPDIPITVAPIVADIDPAWYGSAENVTLVKEIFQLPQVDAGSHTYSHPLNWNFFLRGTFAEEKQLAATAEGSQAEGGTRSYTIMRGHDVPRSYILKPFSITQEIDESIAFINKLLPPGKRVELLQWSGDTLPFEAAVAAARAAGVRNLNGGDTRLDMEYPSYIYVSPIGRQVGGQRQIYAANSNENTYTELFTDRYFGFRDLVQTHRNTESPRRVKPIGVYFHMFSGQKPASLKALQDNLTRIRDQEVIPLKASQYAAVADGFYTVRLMQLSDQSWRIEDRQELQTLRFDNADRREVDFSRSTGVLGQRHYQGSLYVSLDSVVSTPVVALKTRTNGRYSPCVNPYLIQSRWQIWGVQAEKQGLTFRSRGYGKGEMSWCMPQPGMYRVSFTLGGRTAQTIEAVTDSNAILTLNLPNSAAMPVTVTITRAEVKP